MMSAQVDKTTNWTVLARETNYSTGLMAKELGISVRHLEREFSRAIGEHPEKWLNHLRLSDGLALLRSGDRVKEVATSLGYRHSQSFSRAFKQMYGMPPSAM